MAPRSVVIVGAGLAGLRAAETLRREGYDGPVTMIGDEQEPPYDRPPLSKDVLVGTRPPELTYLRPPDKLAALDLKLLLGERAERLDLARKTVDVGRTPIPFDGLILATGASPRMLPDFSGKPNVHVLRTLGDSIGLRDAMDGAEHVTVIGAGFIGSEVAASARERGHEVTIVELETTPLARALGHEMGTALSTLHLTHGTELRLGVTASPVNGRLDLSDGSSLETDLVVVGVGVAPSVGWLEGSGLELDNGVVCDASLRAAPGVFAVGDICNWPNELFGRRQRVEHWTNAAEQARHAARSLVHGTAEPFLGSNYFWSDQYGLRVQFVGSSLADEVAVVDGSVAEREFVAWYRQGERLVGALGIGSVQLIMQSKRLIEARTSWAEALQALEASK